MVSMPSWRECAPTGLSSLARCSTGTRTGWPTSAGPRASLSPWPSGSAEACLKAAETRVGNYPSGVRRASGAIMRPLRYSINVTLDGCVDHRAGSTDEELHRFWAEKLAQADALLFGRVTYEMMQAAWRWPANGLRPEWMAEWMEPFARTIDAAKKYVVSSTLSQVDWNAELLLGTPGREDLAKAVEQLKRGAGAGKGLFVGGVTLPLALAEL